MDIPVKIKGTLAVSAALLVALAVGCDNPARMNESTPAVKHISQTDFATEVSACTNPVVVDFYATWCGPCRILSPMLDRLALPYTNSVKFVKVNLDESPGIAQNYSIQAIPTLLFFRDGKLADRITGLPDESGLKAKLESFAAGK